MLYLSQQDVKKAIQSYEVDLTQRSSDLYLHEQLAPLRHAAVMLPLFKQENDWHLLLTQRAESLQEHRGQVAFPGGAREKQDHNLCETALREMHEEIGVNPKDVQVFGHLGDLGQSDHSLWGQHEIRADRLWHSGVLRGLDTVESPEAEKCVRAGGDCPPVWPPFCHNRVQLPGRRLFPVRADSNAIY